MANFLTQRETVYHGVLLNFFNLWDHFHAKSICFIAVHSLASNLKVNLLRYAIAKTVKLK